MIYDELMAGRVSFQVNPDGTETHQTHAPTSRELRAAREIKKLAEQLQQLGVAHQQLQNLNHQLFQELEHYRNQHEQRQSVVQEPVVDTEHTGVHPVSGEETTGTGSTSANSGPGQA